MKCGYCGNELREDARFCPHCGRTLDPGPAGQPVQSGAQPVPAWEGPEGNKKRTGLLIGAAAAAVAVIALVVVVAGGLFVNPKAQVEKALIKSAASYARAEEAQGLPDLNGLIQDRSWRQEFALTLNSVNDSLAGMDMSALSGLGMRLNMGLDAAERNMDLELSAFWDGEDLLSLLITGRDAELYFSSPQLTGTAYGLNTETMGADLAEASGDESMRNVSFNFFDWMDGALDMMDPEEIDRAVQEANKALWQAAKVKKSGAKTLNVNGTGTKTAVYRLTVPQEAMEDYVDTMAELMSSMNYYDLYEDMFRSMGVSQEELTDFLEALESMDVYGEAAEIIKDGLEELGDLKLDLCLSDGYISAVLFKERVGGSDVDLALYLGGGEEYVDNLSLEMKVDGDRVTVKSSGDHGAKSGVFTDKTTLRASMTTLSSELRYDTKGDSGNFSWEISVPGAGSLDMTGSLTAPGGDSIRLALDDVSLKLLGLDMFSLGLEYSLGPNQGPIPMSGDAKLVTQMSDAEALRAALDIQERAYRWASDMEALFSSRLPEELYYALISG